ncbi:AI-2E family transporter [Thermocoleostomius sinensis]|uniref:AI-2E family transporter n=1 Tax=Thermocoleostomius sinensis A174 TaxID=2016057 RepID=A0A9E8ZFM0_9CYAN|nr:AI-2E family transporter [Thermocoleostomius sinensis]WAL62167.1 AI-2E family transporter [Thermocoleostomius sinensis A174]
MSRPSTKHWVDRLDNSRLLRYVLLFALAWAIVQVLAYFASVLIIFTFSAILAFILSFPVKWLRRFLPHGLSVSIVFLLSLAILAGLTLTIGFATLSQAQQFVNNAPALLDDLITIISNLEDFLQQRNIELNLTVLEEQLRNQALSSLGFGLVTLQRVLTSLLDLILIAVVTLFMLLDGARLWKFFLRLFPQSKRERLTVAIQRNFLGFFWGRFLLSVFFGLSSFVVFLILKIPYALVLAMIAGIFDLIPGIGATLGIGLVCLILLPQGIWLSLKVLIGCILLQQVEENLLMPRIMQGSVNINPVVMFFALLVGARIAGLFGLFLAIPIAATLVNLFEIDEMKGEALKDSLLSSKSDPS